jgi:hypothetical protein
VKERLLVVGATECKKQILPIYSGALTTGKLLSHSGALTIGKGSFTFSSFYDRNIHIRELLRHVNFFSYSGALTKGNRS